MTDLRSNNEFDSLEAFFNERLKDASFAPSGKAWEELEAELDLLDKQKRRRRFLWFFTGGLVLLCGLASLWFFVPDDTFNTNTVAQNTEKQITKTDKSLSTKNSTVTNSTNNSETVAENKTEVPVSHNENSVIAEKKNEIADETKKETSAPALTIAKTNTAKTSVASSFETSKIQLAACSKKANPVIFNKVPFKVIEVEGKDGLTRYFAETAVTEEALATIRNAGFEKAFVKNNFDAGSENTIVKNEGVIESSQPVYVANTKPVTEIKKNNSETIAAKETKKEPYTDIAVKRPESILNGIDPTNNNGEPVATKITTTVPLKTENSESKTSNENSNSTGNNITGSDPPVVTETKNNSITNETPPVETKTDPVLQDQSPAKTDSLPPVVAATETKPDSLPKKTEPVDSAKTPTAFVAPVPFTPEWALLLIAGPNIFSSGASSNLYVTSKEQQQPTVNVEAKLQFKPFKKFSFSAGANYTYLSTKQDITDFLFNKKQTTDFIIYSSFGPMNVPMSVLLDGYSTMAPWDTFPCKYSQTSTLNMVNVPLEMNFHFVNKDKFSLFLGLGANNSFAISQSAHLTLHKENFNNDLSYNNVTVNRYSLSMMFSLGCDVRIGKQLYLTFVPSYRYGVTNLSGTNGTTFNPAYFSGNAGLKFKF